MKRSFHATLTRLLRETHAAATEAHATGAPIDEVVAWRAKRRATPSRRELSRRELLLATGAAAVTAPIRRATAATSPTVVVVGAGLAGLSCARALWRDQGIAARVYEWNNRIGGRVETLRGFFANNQVIEQHAEFISSEHKRMRGLAATFGLALENVNADLGNAEDTAWFAGRRYTAAQLAKDWQDFAWELFRNAMRQAPSASYYHANATARAWDNMSVTEWVELYIPGGTASPLGALCLADMVGENGSPAENQSALNLIYTLGYDASTASGFQPHHTPTVAGSDEKYHVVGGNDQIITGLANDLPAGAVHPGHRLVAVRQTPGRAFICSFQVDGTTIDVPADHVVLAIPPTTLRDVDLHTVTLSPVQQLAIAKATLGTNAKIQIQVAGAPWVTDGYTGNLLTNVPICGGWDSSNYQPGGRAASVYVGFPGGTAGATLAARYRLTFGKDEVPAPAALVADTLAQLEPIYPGITAAWAAGPRKAFVNDGNIDPHLRGAYSNFQVGQYTAFGGAQSERAGNLHFAGEHTSFAFQGFMEGAVESGLRAAGEISS
jgi:monoamine oxidase